MRLLKGLIKSLLKRPQERLLVTLPMMVPYEYRGRPVGCAFVKGAVPPAVILAAGGNPVKKSIVFRFIPSPSLICSGSPVDV